MKMVVAVTGGIASGKSTVLTWFAQWGAHDISLDRIAHLLSQPGGSLWQAVIAEFGEEYLLPSGELDRKRLAQLVFADAAARRQLNRLTHPLILERMQQEVGAIQKQYPQAVIAVEVPLLIECALYWRFERVILVDTSPSLQRARLEQAGWSRSEVERRLNAQISLRAKRAFADWVIWNGADLQRTQQQSWRVWQELLQEMMNPSEQGESRKIC